MKKFFSTNITVLYFVSLYIYSSELAVAVTFTFAAVLQFVAVLYNCADLAVMFIAPNVPALPELTAKEPPENVGDALIVTGA